MPKRHKNHLASDIQRTMSVKHVLIVDEHYSIRLELF